MQTLSELAHIVRSKNAGPFHLTFDILFEDPASYRRVKESGVINVPNIVRMYGVPEKGITIYYYDAACAVKFTFPRPIPAGDFADTDIYGAQQHGPLLDLQIP